jgi:uroporphyrinogen decarboxylase
MRHELTDTGITLIGFAGAPWTLASYAIEGRSWKTGHHTKAMLYERPDLLHQILQRITDMLIPYLAMQIEAGAQVIQLFDTWGGLVPTPYLDNFVYAYQEQVIRRLKVLHPTVPVILFMKNSRGCLQHFQSSQADAISIDDLTPITEARTILGPEKTLQGNLDSSILFCKNQQVIEKETQKILQAGGTDRFIFNLGHGVLPGTPRDHVRHVVDTVKTWKHPDFQGKPEGNITL